MVNKEKCLPVRSKPDNRSITLKNVAQLSSIPEIPAIKRCQNQP